MLKKVLWIFIPVLLFAFMIYLLMQGLKRDQSQLPSALLDKPIPDFVLSDLYQEHLNYNKNILLGEVSLVNVWASWCPPCAAEHDVIVQLAQQGMSIFGLNYQDDRSAAQSWLKKRGDPYKKVFYDKEGSVGIDWGVVAVPETFLLDPQGIVRHRHIGELTLEVWDAEFLPIVNKLKAELAHVP